LSWEDGSRSHGKTMPPEDCRLEGGEDGRSWGVDFIIYEVSDLYAQAAMSCREKFGTVSFQ